MKTLFNILAVSISIILLHSCTEEPLSYATTGVTISMTIIDVSDTNAIVRGEVINEGGAPVIEKGVCWSTEQFPIIDDFKTIGGSGAGGFTSYLAGLTANTAYYARAYAIYSTGTGYGNTIMFTTLQKQ